MEDLPQITETIRLPVHLDIPPYLLDHHVEGRVVLPAVEAMNLLAETVKHFRPETDITDMTEARFDKFLYIQPGMTRLTAYADIGLHENGDITANLMTKNRSKKSSITRIKSHASVCYPKKKIDFTDPPLDLSSALEGICVEIPPDKIYRELVPFGPAYHNIQDTLYISEYGALAKAGSPKREALSDRPAQLGSPFPLDAAFHAACVWGQRYGQTVAFPVGVSRRTVFNSTRSGEIYFAHILPLQTNSTLFLFDMRIYDKDGNLYEDARGVQMRDVSAGRVKPPAWISKIEEENPLECIKRNCRAVSMIELKTLMPFSEKILSVHERKRFQQMGKKRKRSYLGARLACKRLSRILSGNDMLTLPSKITTIAPDLERPCCPLTDGDSALPCSVSHDDRFAIAVASDQRVGVDVEKTSGRIMKSGSLFMSKNEQALVRASPLGEIEAVVRIWSIKEAAAKALDFTMADSWNRVQVMDVGQYKSAVRIDDMDVYSAIHEGVDQHLFTLVCRSASTRIHHAEKP